VVRLVALARERRLGELRHFASSRLRSGGDFASSILWSLGPHDLSVLRAIDPSPIASIEAQWLEDGARVILDVELDSGLTARIDLARSNPTKERRFSIVGSSRVALFDDVRAPDRVALTEPGSAAPSDVDGRDAARILEEVRVAWREPLAVEMEHFFDCVEQRSAPLTPFEDGVAVVRALARVEAMSPRRAQTAAGPLEVGEGALLPATSLGG
jgi:predicted dehydrogenase